MPQKKIELPTDGRRVSLKMLAEYLDLSPATISFVLNDVPGRSIPTPTRERVKAAARKFGYQPSLIARSLQGRKTRTIGVLLPELGEGYHSEVMAGVGDVLMSEGYFYFTAHHRHRKDLVEEYPRMLQARGVDGILAIDTSFPAPPSVPTVTVAGHTKLHGVTNVVLDHDRAAELGVGHLYKLGHRKIAYMRGQTFSSDSPDRWRSTVRVAEALGLVIAEELVVQLERDITNPELGFPGVQQLLLRKRAFTAILCFNDISAIGAIRALSDAGVSVPGDISVVGFDDIRAASYHVPRLTTIRQPLQTMGARAATLLLQKLAGETVPETIKIEPELVMRESTAKVNKTAV